MDIKDKKFHYYRGSLKTLIFREKGWFAYNAPPPTRLKRGWLEKYGFGKRISKAQEGESSQRGIYSPEVPYFTVHL